MSSKNALNKRLLAAAEEGNTSAIVESIELGADLECKKTGVKRTPLIICCKNNNLENVKVLVKRGANINTFDEDRKTCLSYAVDNLNEDMICFLLDQPRIDANTVDGRMCSPLELLMLSRFSFTRKCKMLSCFLEKGAHLVVTYVIQGLNVVVLNDGSRPANIKFSKNALLIVLMGGFKNEPDYKKMLKMMIKKSSETSVKNAANCQDNNTNALVEMMKYEGSRNTSKPTRKQFELTEMMMKKGADINHRFMQQNQGHMTPLFMKLCNNSTTPVSAIDYILHHKDFKSTDEDIAKLEGATGEMCKVFQLNHEMMKSGNPMTVEANRDLIEFTLGNMPRSKSRSSSSKSKSSSSKSKSSSSKSNKKSSKGGSRTRKRR